jgi:DNA-directed RNA polymerase specialized sigma24 family protein
LRGPRGDPVDEYVDQQVETGVLVGHREVLSDSFRFEKCSSGGQQEVFVLRDVLGLSASETADVRDTTVASVNSSLQRARASLRLQLGSSS